MENIKFEDFQKLDLRIGKIIREERVSGSEKLIKMQVNFGETQKQIIAGIGKAYEPESLVGKEAVFAFNIEPRQLMGLESQGMILATDNEGEPVILQPEKEVPLGSKIK